jgi:hypothetical protein
MKTKNEDSSYAVGKGWSDLINRNNYTDGLVVTKHGFVDTYMEAGFTMFRFVWQGRQYRRQIRKSMTKRGVAKAARQFVNEIISAK